MRLTCKAARRPGLWLWSAFLVATLACGHKGGDGSGGGGSKPPADPPKPTPPGASLRTDVDLNPMAYNVPTLTTCLKRQDPFSLPEMTDALTVDGAFSDWAKVPTLLSDPLGDAPVGFDVGDVSIASRGEDVAMAVAFAPTADGSLNFEWGGVVARKSVLHSEVRKVLRFYKGQLEQFQDGAWLAVTPDVGTAKAGPNGIELLLTRRLLGDVVTWPIWWARVFSRNETAATVVDSTFAGYFPSMLSQDDLPFTFSVCSNWTARRQPFSFVQIQDSSSGLNARQTGFPIDQAAEWTDQLARLAFDATLDTIGGDALPSARLGVLSTVNTITATTDSTGVGDAWLGDAAPYRGFFSDANRLGPAATEGYPEGAVVEQSASLLLDMYLQNLMPTAPAYLTHAMRQALLDHLIIKYLGMSYWLDYFSPTIDALVAGNDAKSPTPISTMDPASPVTQAKVVAFGHLLGRDQEPKSLITAWKAAASLVLAGTDPSTALKRALVAERDTDTVGAARFSHLWSGWLEAGAYDAAMGPDAMDDKDQDGLPNYLEAKYGTRFDIADTDGDGWTDAAEVILGTDPKLESRSPAVIVADGDFSDWQVLLPKRLNIDKGTAGDCPKAADINYYSAVVNRDDLIIGAVASDFWPNEPLARWEAVIDFPEKNRQLLVTASGNSHDLVVKKTDSLEVLKRYRRATPTANKTIEWSIHRDAFKLDSYFDSEGAVRIRLRTVYTQDGEDRFCDETDWFEPSISN